MRGTAHSSWTGVLGYGPDGALTRAGESDAEEHKITPCVSLISRSAALDTNHLKVDGVKKSAHQNQHAAVNTAQTGRADRRARHTVSEGLIWLAAHRSRPERHVGTADNVVRETEHVFDASVGCRTMWHICRPLVGIREHHRRRHRRCEGRAGKIEAG